MTAAQQPATAAQQPATAAQQPATAAQQPATAAQQPATAAQQPEPPEGYLGTTAQITSGPAPELVNAGTRWRSLTLLCCTAV